MLFKTVSFEFHKLKSIGQQIKKKKKRVFYETTPFTVNQENPVRNS
jgi:hypothetical protein